MRIPTTRILKYAAMGVIAACIATLFLKKEKPKGHPRDYAEIADQQVIRAATEYNSISFHVDGDTLAGFHYEMIEAFALNRGWKATIIPETVSYTHLTLPTMPSGCSSVWWGFD